MSTTTPRLVLMANQIAVAFRTQGEIRAEESTLEHLRQFWDPRMRSLIVAHLDAGGVGLNDTARAAIERLAVRPPTARDG